MPDLDTSVEELEELLKGEAEEPERKKEKDYSKCRIWNSITQNHFCKAPAVAVVQWRCDNGHSGKSSLCKTHFDEFVALKLTCGPCAIDGKAKVTVFPTTAEWR